MRAKENNAARIRTQDAAADWSMTGTAVLFTGASRGMGLFAAIGLARLGAEVLVVGRNQRGAPRRSRRSAAPAVRYNSCARPWATPPRSATWRPSCSPAAGRYTC
jgi:NADPH:quinone reductase-like Zn-dependent oxidoreductase